ncbi:unnamed protein product, partial [Mesorhabditis belari]|uniref:Major sperm protein n=1 Tax=Mesorhabditis belari TaxID=2138241 RepID=A0AAF3ES91_9BILA
MSSSSMETAIPRSGEMPDSELRITPRWMIFRSMNAFQQPVLSCFELENVDPFPIAFVIKGKDRHFPIVKHAHGLIAEKGKMKIEMLIPSRVEWPEDLHEMTNKRFRLVVSNLAISQSLYNTTPDSERSLVAREIFQRTAPLTRMYTKMSYVLIRPLDLSDETQKLNAQ